MADAFILLSLCMVGSLAMSGIFELARLRKRLKDPLDPEYGPGEEEEL